MATIKELESELSKARRSNVLLSRENVRMASLLKQVEPALAQANQELGELHVEAILKEKAFASNEQNLKQALDERDKYIKLFDKESGKSADVLRDLHYEKSRRISAENKAFDLEQRLLQVANSEYIPSEVQNLMEGLRIDRHGEIA